MQLMPTPRTTSSSGHFSSINSRNILWLPFSLADARYPAAAPENNVRLSLSGIPAGAKTGMHAYRYHRLSLWRESHLLRRGWPSRRYPPSGGNVPNGVSIRRSVRRPPRVQERSLAGAPLLAVIESAMVHGRLIFTQEHSALPLSHAH